MKPRRNFVLGLLVLTALFALSAVSPVRANTIWYVDYHAPAGTQTGVSWGTAFATLDQAIAAASPTLDSQGQSDEIWVAIGKYHPAAPTWPPDGYFINKPLKLFGGFLGNENTVQARAGSFARTVLDGNIGDPGQVGDNVVHVVHISSALTVVIDGFKITNGNSTISQQANHGAGILSVATNLDLANCFVRSNEVLTGMNPPNRGGGLYFTGGASSVNTLRIKNCEFEDNLSDEGGAICAAINVQGEVVNTRILSNDAALGGGGVCLKEMGPADRFDFTNCVFWGNQCYGSGFGAGLDLGGYPTTAGNARLVNCTIADNSGPAIRVSPTSQAAIHNSIVFSNPSSILDPALATIVTYSDIEGGWTGPGGNNISSDPQFVNHLLGDLSLSLGSDCLDRADYGQLPADTLDLDGDGDLLEIIPWDMAWHNRWKDLPNSSNQGAGLYTWLDMGAYEHQ